MKHFYSQKSFTEALPKFSTSVPRSKKESYLTEVSVKLNMPVEKLTIGDMVKYQWKIEELVILELGKGVLKLKHVKKGRVEIHYFMPVKLN